MEKVLRENLSEGNTFVDIGAYIGYYSVLARNIVGESGKVISFEPNPESYKMLKKNIQLNGYKNCIPENIALSDEEGFFKLFIGAYTDDSSSMFLAEIVDENRYVRVETMTFDNYCELHRIAPDLVKIDAEGAEHKILKGGCKVIDKHHPKFLIELHPLHLEKQGIALLSVFEFLEERRYRILLVNERGTKDIPINELVDLCKAKRKNIYGTPINQVILCL